MQKFKFPSEVKLKSEIYFTRKTAYANSTLKSWQNKFVYLKGPCSIVMICDRISSPSKIRRERNKKYKYAYVLHIKENHAQKGEPAFG